MADQLEHRGPDDSGVWADGTAGVALGFRRLAILDLSPAGHQPMHSTSGRYVIAFNGEVYNFRDLRRELERMGHTFRGRSDTEVVLASIEQWGVREAVRRFVGMFAFAVWDRTERNLTLVRDRLGIKPLYYGWAGHTFLCGSELKALCAHPDFSRKVDRGALSLYVRHLYVPTPYSIYEGTFKLPPGHLLEVRADSPPRSPKPTPYWSAVTIAAGSDSERFHDSDEALVERLDALLRDAVRMRMVADVPLGAFLSGGIDSSLVVSMMQAQSARPVKTFTVGFHERGFNEAEHAKAVAQHLGTEHTELYVTPAEAMAAIPHLPDMFDEPFADSSQIPTFLVSKLTRECVTVSLSGDGGDEVFGGYRHYLTNALRWRLWGWCPPKCHCVVGAAILAIAGRDPHHPNSLLPKVLADRLQLEARLISRESRVAMYREYLSTTLDPLDVVVGGWEPEYNLSDRAGRPLFSDFSEEMMYLDSVNYLPDDILTKLDRASMAVSLEARVPLLDHRIVEFARRLPISQKLRDGQGKWILRQILDRYVPREIVDRPKRGFGVPVEIWMRGPLREWAESLLNERKMKDDGFLNAGLVRSRWNTFLDGRTEWHSHLWGILMFQAWRLRWLP